MVHGLVMRSLWSQALSFALILYKVYDNKKMFSFWTFSVSFMSSYLYLSQPLSIFYFGWILFARPYRANLAFRHCGHYISQTLMYEIIISFLMCNLSLKKKSATFDVDCKYLHYYKIPTIDRGDRWLF